MRLIVLLAASIAAAGPAAAEGWTEYAYPKDAFTVAFPAAPTIETTTYQAADGRAVAARVYSVAREGGVFKMTVADLQGAATEENAVIDHAVKALSQGGEVKLDIPHRISRVYGRQLSIAGPEGSRSMAAVFYFNKRLYQIEGKALPGNPNAAADAIRFQQSLEFTDGGTNRTE
jgi:hypothetical protein